MRTFFYRSLALLTIVSAGFLHAESVLSELDLKQPQYKERLANKYSPNFMRYLEISFDSDGMISQGGYESVDVLFKGVDLEGKKCLDVGSGLGGVDIYLAKKHRVDITGVEVEAFLVERAEKLLMQEQANLKGKVSFELVKSVPSYPQFPDNSFDIVFSKEVMYNIPYELKQEYLNEMYRVLKPGGKLIIADWYHTSSQYSDAFKSILVVKGFNNYVTPEEFRAMLEVAQFSEITFRDAREEHIEYSKQDLERIVKAEKYIREELGRDVQEAVRSTSIWLQAQEDGELLSGHFTASKGR